jgi:hypothetical protein
MNLGWIISGPGSTWVNKDLQLVRCPPINAHVFHESPAVVLKELEKLYKCRFRVERLKTEYVGTWRDGQWAEMAEVIE